MSSLLDGEPQGSTLDPLRKRVVHSIKQRSVVIALECDAEETGRTERVFMLALEADAIIT